MRYTSTRGKIRDLSFQDILFSGYADDGGLYVPENIPVLKKETLDSWKQSNLSYPQIVANVVRLFISEDELPTSVLYACIETTYSKFDIPEIIALKEFKNENGESFKVAELFHGPTASFKDYALLLVGQFMEYFLSKEKRNVVVLIGTSGDTGSAAIKAVEGLKNIDIVVLYPDGNISPVQELQMNSSTEKNVHVFAVEGTSDDLDIPIKQCFPDKRLCSINSINWARIMIQVAHYVYFYLQEDAELDIFVPTGAAGNVAAGVVASLMGIPIKLFVATNENYNVEAFMNKGELRMGGQVIPTPANAMDIGMPYNLERIIHFFSKSTEITGNIMKRCEAGDTVQIPNELHDKIREVILECKRINNEDIYETMRKFWALNNYMICPHTATAVSYFNSIIRNPGESFRKAIVVSTASPQKFPEISEKAGVEVEKWNGNKLYNCLKSGVQTKPDKSMRIGADWFKLLQNKILEIECHSNILSRKLL